MNDRSRFPHWRRGLAALGFGAAALLAACGGGGGGGGQLNVSLTDAQTCDYQDVFVTITQVLVHRDAGADEEDGGWIAVPMPVSPLRVDLMTLSNGVSQALGTLPLDAGTYEQVRLVLAENAGGPPYANQLTLANSTQVALTTPSAQQTGLKLNVNMTIEAGQTAELVLDFDPCKSVVRAGNSGMYLLKPVITAYFDAINAIQGYTVAGATVSAQQGGASVKATVADGTGRFVLWPVEPGAYDLVITAADRANAVLTGVTVADGGVATVVVSEAGTPLVAPPSATRSVGGDITTDVEALNVDLAARQALDGGPTIEVAAQPIAVSTGAPVAYSFSLAAAKPVRSAWASGTTAYAFADDASSAGAYTVLATPDAVGEPAQELPADISTDNDLDVNFVFDLVDGP